MGQLHRHHSGYAFRVFRASAAHLPLQGRSVKLGCICSGARWPAAGMVPPPKAGQHSAGANGRNCPAFSYVTAALERKLPLGCKAADKRICGNRFWVLHLPGILRSILGAVPIIVFAILLCGRRCRGTLMWQLRCCYCSVPYILRKRKEKEGFAVHNKSMPCAIALSC